MDSDIGVPIGAKVKVTKSGRRLLVDDDGKVNTRWSKSHGLKHHTRVSSRDLASVKPSRKFDTSRRPGRTQNSLEPPFEFEDKLDFRFFCGHSFQI